MGEPLSDIDHKQLRFTETQRPLPKCEPESLGFGKVISDHMLKVVWKASSGWGAPEIVPSGPIGLHPFSHVFHYAIECYEGMKAYVDNEGEVRLFRPKMNMDRFNASAARLSLPAFDGSELLECIKELLRKDRDWIPAKRGYAMYLRPVMFSTTPWLGLTQCSEAMIFVLMSPVGPYFKSGFVPIKLNVETSLIRAWPGGTGHVKAGGNYGPTVRSQIAASKAGCSQALFCYGEKNWITEAGTMNVFFLVRRPGGDALVTPSLEEDCILPGVTRQTCIDIAKEWGYGVEEKMLALDEVVGLAREGCLLEAFGTGTAAVIQPISGFVNEGEEFVLPAEGLQPGSLQQRLTERIFAIQYGEVPDHEWSIKIT
mmetsp:Transcript_20731/g.70534  ORF Transcript_20731/g.70534 Transcript_20731/m.70534 type:complete len:370 (-) Transcript_20731:174-1283(-)